VKENKNYKMTSNVHALALNSTNTLLNYIKRLPAHINQPEYEFTIRFSLAVLQAFAPAQFPQNPFELKRFQGNNAADFQLLNFINEKIVLK
jgi:hypothetical protein